MASVADVKRHVSTLLTAVKDEDEAVRPSTIPPPFLGLPHPPAFQADTRSDLSAQTILEVLRTLKEVVEPGEEILRVRDPSFEMPLRVLSRALPGAALVLELITYACRCCHRRPRPVLQSESSVRTRPCAFSNLPAWGRTRLPLTPLALLPTPAPRMLGRSLILPSQLFASGKRLSRRVRSARLSRKEVTRMSRRRRRASQHQVRHRRVCDPAGVRVLDGPTAVKEHICSLEAFCRHVYRLYQSQ